MLGLQLHMLDHLLMVLDILFFFPPLFFFNIYI